MKRILLFLFLLMAGSQLRAQTLQLDSTLLHITVAVDSTKINGPWDIEWGFDNRIWMTDAKGIKAWDPVTGNMKTLFRFAHGFFMGLAVPKTLPPTGPVYIYATFDTTYYYASGSLIRLYRFEYNSAADTLTNLVILVAYTHLSEHSGGKVMIGQDGKIWLTTAEYTFTNDTLGALNGRVLRMNPDGSAPPGNLRPDLTYTIGHRNPQGMVQLPDGKIYSSEHSGPSPEDEINRITLGGQYGWPAMEGFNHCTNFIPDSCASATFIASHKGAVYRGSTTPAGLDYYDHPAIPEWRNCLIVGTLYQPDSCLAVLQLNSSHDSIISRRNYLKKYAGGINDFIRTRDICAAPDGSIYCLVRDRSFLFTNDSLINKGTKIIRLKNDAYIPTGIISPATATGLKIYPNPATGFVYIETGSHTLPLRYEVVDAGGKQLASGTLRKTMSQIPTGSWPAGIYTFIVGGAKGERKKISVR